MEKDNMIKDARWIEYPSHDLLLSGLQDDTIYEYVSHTYLNGMVNYVKPQKMFLIETYEREEEFNDDVFNKIVMSFEERQHTELGKFGNNIMMLASCDGIPGWIYFYFDGDVSDCCVGRFGGGTTLSEAIKEFTEYAEFLDSRNDNQGLREIPLSAWRGWGSF